MSRDVTLKELYEIFETFGRIEEKGINIKTYDDNTMAFVNYAYRESAEKAIKTMDKACFNFLVLNVEFAIKK